jgi:hypothetical protein
MFSVNDQPSAGRSLECMGLKQSWAVHRGALFFVILFVVAAAAAFFAVEVGYKDKTSIDGAGAATAVLAVGAFLIGYNQWRSAKHETSMERYYERLKLANEARSCLTGDEHKIDPLDLYIFVELDNLEYVIQKYRLGYMTSEQALRGVRTFLSRPKIQGFRERLSGYSDLVELAGYHPETQALVQSLLRQTPFAG